jgi:hypothetical protein
MAIFPGSAIPSAVSDYEIDNSLRFNDDDSAYLSRVQGDGSRKTWTVSFWFKRGNLGIDRPEIFGCDDVAGVILGDAIRFPTSDIMEYLIDGGTYTVKTTQVFRDPSAWYHTVIATDTTQAVAANRVKFYVNGEIVTDFSTASYPTQDYEPDGINNDGKTVSIGKALSTKYYDGYLAEFFFVDGTALTPSSFGELDSDTNQWKPLDSDTVKDAVTFGTNGFYQKYNSTELAASFADSAIHTIHTVTANGDAHTDTTIKKIGTASAQFDGTGDYLSIPDSSDWDITTDWTLEFWVYPTSDTGDRGWVSQVEDDSNGWYFRNISAGDANFTMWSGGSAIISISTTGSPLADDTWQHVAFVKDSDDYEIYVDGVLKKTASDASMDTFSAPLVIGSILRSSPQPFDGYIDELRISNIARYTTAFTPSTTEFTADVNTLLLLHMDGSDSGTTFTDSSDGPRHTITDNGDVKNVRGADLDATYDVIDTFTTVESTTWTAPAAPAA